MKLNINKDFFKTWTSDMAYVFGIIVTDGCLIERNNGFHCVDITNNEIDLLENIKKTMGSEHKICKKKQGGRFQFRNQSIYSDLLRLCLTPRKSKTIKFPKVPLEYLSDFIRGCFDGDGGVTIWREPRWRHAWQIRITFASGSKEFLEGLHKALVLYGKLQKGKIWYSGRAHELHFGIGDSLRFYKFAYPESVKLYLRRKKKAFERFIKLRHLDN